MNERDDFPISSQGVRLPWLLYGTAWKKDRTAGLVEQALTLGFRGIDTACQPRHYDEAGVGDGLRQALAAGLRREEIYLQTKFTPLDGQDPHGLPYDPEASLPEQVAQSFARSLLHLRTRQLDCLLLHSPLPDPRDLLQVWRAMEDIVDASGARQLGISNCYQPDLLERLYRMARVKPAVVQNRFHALTGYDRRIRDICRTHGILYQGFWTLTANPHVLADPALLELARRYARTPAQIFYRFLTQSDVIPLIGTTSTRHMREDLAIFDFELQAGERAVVERLL